MKTLNKYITNPTFLGLVMVAIFVIAFFQNLTVRYDIHLDNGGAFYNARIVSETENTITVISDEGMQVQMSKVGIRIIRR